MAQSVYNIPDSSGVDFLTNINAVLGAIQTINSGATPPTNTEAGMWWGDISDPNTFYLKMRNHTNDGWVNLYAYDVATSTIRALSNGNYCVETVGDQTIAGVKTFTSSPIVPVATNDNQTVSSRATNITVDVGAGQTYTTINQALEYLSGFYPLYKSSGVTATINLKAGFVMNEQVLVRGLDLGWITIVGEDAETIITHTALTTDFTGADYGFNSYPAFGVSKGGVSPRIGQLFRFSVEKVGGDKHGLIAVGAGSSAEVLSYKGFIGAGSYGIYAYGGSTINVYGANASNAGTYGIFANGGSTIHANSANASSAGTYGIVAYESSSINAYSANASSAGGFGIYAHGGSTINALSAIIQNQTTGVSCIRVTDGSHIEASGINTTGSTVTVLSQTANTLTANGIIYQ